MHEERPVLINADDDDGQEVSTIHDRRRSDPGNQWHGRGAPPGARNGRYLHGMKGRPEWKAWVNARRRCTDPNHPDWKNYGGRGITMCAEWLASFAAFYAHIGPRPDGLTLDRRDNDRGYEPGNVRWATRAEQNANKRRQAA